MAVATGSQIRPELSAVDYTPFLQAAGQSAQMQAQGIAAGVGGALKGFESYVQQQKENKQLESKVKSGEKIATALGNLLKDVNPQAATEFGGFVSTLSDPNASLRDRAAVAESMGPLLNNILNLAQAGKQVQEQKAAAEYAGLLRSGGGAVPAPISNAALSRFTPEQRLAGEEMYLKGEQTRAGIQETRAKTTALGIPKVQDLTFQEQAYNSFVQAEESRLNRKLTPSERSEVFRQVMTMSRPTTTIKTAEDQLAGPVYQTMVKDRDAAQVALNSLTSYAEADKLLKNEKVITGAGAEARLMLAKGLSLFGIGQDAVENTEVLRAQLAAPVFALVKNLGSGAGISNADREFAEKAAGNIALDRAAIIRLVDIGRRASELTVKRYTQKLDKVYPAADEDVRRVRSILELYQPEQAPSVDITASIPVEAKDFLKQRPELKADFDKKYGAGSADAVLGQQK